CSGHSRTRSTSRPSKPQSSSTRTPCSGALSLAHWHRLTMRSVAPAPRSFSTYSSATPMPRTASAPILAIDPGLRDLGYAVVAGRRLVARDVIALRNVPKSRRLQEAKARITALARAHRPRTIVVERTYRHSVPWLNDLHRISQAAQRLAIRHRIA